MFIVERAYYVYAHVCVFNLLTYLRERERDREREGEREKERERKERERDG